MTRQVGVIASSLILCSAVLADRVLTRDGRVLQGKISFGENGDVKVTVPSTTHNVTSANLARVFLKNSKSKPGLSDMSFRLYQGNWKQLPDFNKLTIDKSGQMSADRIDLSPLGMNEGPRVFDLKQGETLDRWSAPMIEGRPFSINATVEACGDGGVEGSHAPIMTRRPSRRGGLCRPAAVQAGVDRSHRTNPNNRDLHLLFIPSCEHLEACLAISQ